MAFGLKRSTHGTQLVKLHHFTSSDMPLFDPRTHPAAVILLAFVLAAGFLLVILSCALWNNWLPLLVALTFVMAPLPNSICSRCGNAGDYSETNSAYIDFGRFLTGMFVVTGLALPVLLAHSALIEPAACYMSIAGGGLVYGTILVYSGWFGAGGDDEF